MGGIEAKAPDGTQWRVRRQWTSRPARLHWRKPKVNGERWWDSLDFLSFADDLFVGLAVSVVIGIVVVLTVLFVWPLLALGIELLIVLLFLISGVIGRVIFRRPWTIRAIPVQSPEPAREWKVVGWLDSRRLMREIAAGLENGTALPAHIG